MAQHRRIYKINEGKRSDLRCSRAVNKIYMLGIKEFVDLTNDEFLAKYTRHSIPSFHTSSKTSLMYGKGKAIPASPDCS